MNGRRSPRDLARAFTPRGATVGAMRFRHSALSLGLVRGLVRVVPFAAAAAGAALASVATGACANSGPDNLHGPTYGDGGTEGGGAGEGGHEAGGGLEGGPGGHDAGDGSAASADGAGTVDGQTGSTDGATDGPGTEAGNDAALGDASDAGPTDGGATCPSTMALLATGASSIAQAVYGHGQWSTAVIVAGGGSAAPSLVPLGGGYLGVFVGTGSAGNLPLQWTAYTGSWSPPAHVAAALAQGVPALAVTGSTAHVVYWGSDDKFYHGTYGASWDAASDPLKPSGGAQSFGPSAPAAAAVGSALLAAQSGQDGVVYAQGWSGSWAAAAAVAGSSVVTSLSPAVVALGGGAADAMLVFVHAGDAGSYYLEYATRAAGAWSAPANVYAQGGTVAYAGSTPALVALPGGKAVLAWQGGSPAYAYVSSYDPARGWSAPIAVSSDVLASPPSVAPGVCGADAVMAYVKTGGGVSVVTLSGGSWGTPVPVTGATGMQGVAIATSP